MANKLPNKFLIALIFLLPNILFAFKRDSEPTHDIHEGENSRISVSEIMKRYDSDLDNMRIVKAGKELKKASRRFYRGLGIMGVGGMVTVMGVDSEPIAAIGVITIIGGYFLVLESHSHVGKAGEYLIKSSQYSVKNTPKRHMNFLVGASGLTIRF